MKGRFKKIVAGVLTASLSILTLAGCGGSSSSSSKSSDSSDDEAGKELNVMVWDGSSK